MFDISVGELALVGLVALIVIGPHQLPKMSNMLGRWLRYLRNTWAAVSAEMDQQIQTELTEKQNEHERDTSDH
jgi:sec-independent protein translocase protein TatB